MAQEPPRTPLEGKKYWLAWSQVKLLAALLELITDSINAGSQPFSSNGKESAMSIYFLFYYVTKEKRKYLHA